MNLKKPLLIASLTAAVGMAAVSTQAQAGDPLVGALIGGGIGAAIGHDVNRHGGAAVGGLLGAVVGSSIAADSGPYYSRGYAPAYGYDGGYYAPAPVYAEPVYAGPVYPSYGVSYVYGGGPRYYYGDRDRGYRRDWREGRRDGHEGRRDWREDNRHWH